MIIIKKRHVVQPKRPPDELVADAPIPQAAPEPQATKSLEAHRYVPTGRACTRCHYICPAPCDDNNDMCARGLSWNIKRRGAERKYRDEQAV